MGTIFIFVFKIFFAFHLFPNKHSNMVRRKNSTSGMKVIGKRYDKEKEYVNTLVENLGLNPQVLL